MRVLVALVVVALAGAPVTQAACQRSREAGKPECACCGDACTGNCCCAGKGERAPRTLGACACSKTEPRAVERPTVGKPALVAVPLVTVRASRPATAAQATAPREAPAPVPGFRPPLLL